MIDFFVTKKVIILKSIDEEYRNILINCRQNTYLIINFTVEKLIEMKQTDRDKEALYLFNNIKIQ